MSAAPLVIVFPLYPQLTQLDFTGPHQFLCRLPGAEIVLASARGGEVEAEGGVVFARTVRLADVDRCDVICVPGGLTCTDAALDPDYLPHVRRLAQGARYVTSVCTGSLILGAAGLLKGYRATCHWLSLPQLAILGAEPVAERVVVDRNRITGAGVTSGIDFALVLVERIFGDGRARLAQLSMEYDPKPPFPDGSPASADPALVALAREAAEPFQKKRADAARRAAAALGEL